MNEEKPDLPIEPDLEARIVALVLGEASDFETGELERLIKSRPELAAFKHEMELVSRMLREVGQTELETPDADWQLSRERRQVVLNVIHGKVTASTIGAGKEANGKPPRLRKRRWTQILEAALATAILFVLTGLMLPAFQKRRDMSVYLAPAETKSDSTRGWRAEPLLSSAPFSSEGLASMESESTSVFRELQSGRSGSPGHSSRQNSEAALSAIQDSLQGSRATSSFEPAANVFSAQPMSDSPQSVTPPINTPQHASAPGDVSGTGSPSAPLNINSITDRSGIDPDQADKLIAGFQEQRGVPQDGTPADPLVAAPDGGTILLGGIKSGGKETSAGEVLLDLPVLDSIEKQKHSADRELARGQAEEGSLVSPDEIQLNIAGGSGTAGQTLSRQPGVFKGNEQQGGHALAENGAVAGFDIQFPDPTMAGDDHWYRSATNGRDAPGGNSDEFGDSGGESGRGGGFGGGQGTGEGLGFDTQITPRVETKNGDGMPGGGKRDAGGFEYGQSAPAMPGSPTQGESFGLTMEEKKESGESGKWDDAEEESEAEKTLELSDGEDFRYTEELRKKHLGDEERDGRGEGYLKQQSAEQSLKRMSDRQREFESELTRGGQNGQNLSVNEVDKNGERLANDGIAGEDGKTVRSLEHSRMNSKDTSRGELNAGRDDVLQSLSGEIAGRSGKSGYKRGADSAGMNETSAATGGFSTFSLHVSDVSFKLAAAALARGEWPEAAKIRIEEFVNAFDYGDPLPCANEKVACVVEQAVHPFLQQRNVLRVSMRTSAEGRAANTPLRLTLVLDNSGSMERIDRQQAVRRALSLLARQLSPNDQVTLISFARQPRLLAENISGTELGKLVELIGQIPSEGGTNIEAALGLAFEKAASQQIPGAQNRIVLLTDGAVNLGNADPESLSRMVETMRTAGIAFDAAGISADGLNDEILEALTRKGDGRYYLLDGEESSGGRFAQQIAGALRPSASNVKVQVEFNPNRVGQYKLLGFEKHLLQQEDFRNDAVDAAELAAAEAGVALYQFEAKPDGEGDVGTVSVRFRDLATGQMVEQRWPIPYEANALRPDQAASPIRLATAAAMLAARLRGDALGETVDLKFLSDLVAGLSEQQQHDPRVQQLKLMIEQARQLIEQ